MEALLPRVLICVSRIAEADVIIEHKLIIRRRVVVQEASYFWRCGESNVHVAMIWKRQSQNKEESWDGHECLIMRSGTE